MAALAVLSPFVPADIVDKNLLPASSSGTNVLKATEQTGGIQLPHVSLDSRAAAAADVHAPGANTAAVVTYSAAGSGVRHVVTGIAWSYNGDPTAGNLKIEDGSGTTVFTMDITSGGAGFIPFPFPKRGTANTSMIVTLAAGGDGISGKVSVLNHWTE